MITWLLGRSGVGKTRELTEKLPELSKGYSRVYYLVPEQSSMELERVISRAGLSNVKVLSFRRLCNEIFRTYGGVAGNYMSKSRETALIYRVLQEQQKNLRYYRKARPTMGFVDRLAQVFSEFSLSGLGREAAFTALEQSGRRNWQEKYDDLFLLYEAYLAALNQENRSAAEDLSAATARAREQGFFAGTAVLIDGFFGFTGRQREMLEVMFRQSECVYCALLLDPEDPAPLFAPVKGELAALERLARAAGAPCKREVLPGPSRRLQQEDLRRLERDLFSMTSAPMEEARHVRILAGRNIREELSMVAADIAKKVREENLRYRDIALIAGDLSEYGPVAETVFAKYGVPLFADRGRASLGKPVFAFVQSALRLISPERYFRLEDLLIFLKTGLCGEDPDLVSRLENYCILWQIQGERLIREADWTQNPAGLCAPDEESAALLAELNGLRRRIREPLLRFRDKAAAGTGAALAEGLYGLLCDFQVEKQLEALAQAYLESSAAGANAWETQQNRRLSREYLRLYSVLLDILDDIYAVFGSAPLSLYAMEELIGLCGEQTALNVTPPTLDAVALGEVAHSRLHDIRILYVVGANQGLLPMQTADSGLISDRERQFFAAHGLPCNATRRQETLQGQHRFYAALFSAREELVFSYSAFDMRGEALIPSSYLDRLQRLTGLKPQYRSDMDLYDFAVTPAGARELTGWAPALRTEILAELGERPLPPRNPEERLPEEVTRRIFGNRLKLSYSQINLYQQCPFRYFIDKTMRIRPQQPITFDAANIGTFVHYGLERLIRTLQQENHNYDKYTKEEIILFGDTVAQEYREEQLRDMDQTNRFQALYRRMTQLFCLIAENVLGELREGGYRPYGAEVSLNGTVVRLKNGAEAELTGSVDRVDVYEAEGQTYLKVIDYKTGTKSFTLQDVTNMDGVQLPIYLYGLIKSGRWTHPVPAAGCYLEAKPPAFKKPVKAEELHRELRCYYRRDGLFSKDETALAALDAEGGSRYFNIDYTKDGALSKKKTNLYPPELMSEIVEYMETVIRETAEGIYGGNVAPRPLKGKNHDACRYCQMAQICRWTEEGPRRVYSEDPFGWKEDQE